MKLQPTLGILSSLFLFQSCSTKDVSQDCKAPSLITAIATCNPAPGLVFTAAVSNPGLPLTWTVIAVRDSASKGWSGSDPVIEANTASPSFTVPDTVIQKYQTIVVRASVQCPGGNSLYSIYYRYFRARSAGGCYTWTAAE